MDVALRILALKERAQMPRGVDVHLFHSWLLAFLDPLHAHVICPSLSKFRKRFRDPQYLLEFSPQGSRPMAP